MNFNHLSYLPIIIIIFLVFCILMVSLEFKFFRMVKTYWFYNRSIFSYISSFSFLAGLFLLIMSLLDMRGPEERIKTPIPNDRTIILIDTSASMLAEDVKPSRLQKAVLLAKHFARKAAGHQLAIVAFAEIQKKIVPFTSDIDLIDARLDSIKNLRNQNGSSALSIAIQESIQYFKETGEMTGNILVLTDGEETSDGIGLKVPKEINIALIGIGTEQGGRIPLDDSRGFRFGYKKNKGSDVVTKLDERFFKKVVSDIPSGKYWIANTYTLPSEEILTFFKSQKIKGLGEQDMVIKPVMMEWLVIPAILLIIISYGFKMVRVFALGLIFLIVPLHAKEEKAEPLSPDLVERLQSLQAGSLNKLEKIKLADDLLQAGAKDEAIGLYEENIPLDKYNSKIPPEAYLNYGTALLEKGEAQKGLRSYETLAEGIDLNSEKGKHLNETIEKNVLSYFKNDKKKEQEKKDKENKDKNEKDDKNDKKGQSGQGQSMSDGKSGDQDQKQNKRNDEKQEPEKDKDKDKKLDKDDNGKGDDKQDNDKDKSDDGDKGDKKPLPQKKIPAKLKQLMSDDRQLQMKIIEQGTKDLNRRNSQKGKDW